MNLISVAFGVLFVGLAVDFSIQFCIRYRDRRHELGALDTALAAAARTIGPSLALAAGATAIGFLSFVPTPYVGVRELGWIGYAAILVFMIETVAGLAYLWRMGAFEWGARRLREHRERHGATSAR